MSVHDRQSDILTLLQRQGAVEVDDLAGRFGVSTQTIRQDLRDLDQQGRLQRTHGGARRVAHVNGRDYRDRRQHRGPEKAAIGAAAAALIPDGASVALNIGTTTEQVAAALALHDNLMVLSNNINVITALSGSETNELVLVGGRVRHSDGAVVGEDAVEFISRYKVDFAVIGCSSLDPDGAILDFDAREVSVARAILRNARTRILVADATKFDTRAPVRISTIAEIDHFVTDAAPPAAFSEAARAGGTRITVTGQSTP